MVKHCFKINNNYKSIVNNEVFNVNYRITFGGEDR